MKELSIEEKAKRYDDAKARMSRAFNSNRCTIGFMNEIFPELKESEDEKVRKTLIELVKCNERCGYFLINNVTTSSMLAWLEKQGKNKPKFKVGNWIINKSHDICLITDIDLENGYYICEHNRFGNTDGDIDLTDKEFHLWSIQDAKDGDVLASNKSIFIFQEEYICEKPTAYCGLMNGLFIEGNGACWTNEECYPATKEQRDTLLKAMADAGYTFDFEKKELKKDAIYNKYENPAWSEEDDKIQNDLIWIIEAYRKNGFNKGHFETANRAENWLKSIKDRVQLQSQWKPTDNQIASITCAVRKMKESACYDSELVSLFNDLKKLREG